MSMLGDFLALSAVKDVLVPLTVSISGTFFAAGIVYFSSERLRRIIFSFSARLLRIDLERTFAGRSAASKDLSSEIARAQFVHLITGRGQELQTEEFSALLADRLHSRRCDFRILLPSVSTNLDVDWTAVNDKMMANVDPAYGNNLLKQQIEITSAMLKRYKKDNNNLHVRRFNSPHIGRVIVTDNCAYFNPYNETAHARFNPVYKFYAGGSMYRMLKRLFDVLWENSPEDDLLLNKTQGHRPDLLPSPGQVVSIETSTINDTQFIVKKG